MSRHFFKTLANLTSAANITVSLTSANKKGPGCPGPLAVVRVRDHS